MSQEIVNVTLSQSGDDDLLTFDIRETYDVDAYSVNLSDSTNSQAQLKRIFSRLLTLLIVNDIKLNLVVDSGFTRALQKEVSTEYIKDLNEELVKVRATILSEEEAATTTENGEDEAEESEDELGW